MARGLRLRPLGILFLSDLPAACDGARRTAANGVGGVYLRGLFSGGGGLACEP